MKKKHFSLLLNLLLSSTLFWGVPAAGDPSIETERANLATKVVKIKGPRAMIRHSGSGDRSGEGSGD